VVFARVYAMTTPDELQLRREFEKEVGCSANANPNWYIRWLETRLCSKMDEAARIVAGAHPTGKGEKIVATLTRKQLRDLIAFVMEWYSYGAGGAATTQQVTRCYHAYLAEAK
jgi:hypothetical protein